MWMKACLVAIVAALVVSSTFPSLNNYVYHVTSNVWPPTRANKVIGYAHGLIAYSVISTALDLELFEMLQHGPMTAKQLANRLSIPVRGVETILDALVALDLVQYNGGDKGTYILTSAATYHLLKSSHFYCGAMFHIWRAHLHRFANLSNTVRKGTQVFNDSAETPNHDFWEVFADETFRGSHLQAQALSSALSLWIQRQGRIKVLDVAAGSGVYGYDLAETYSNVHVTLLDWPNVIPHTRENMKKYAAKLNDTQVAFLEGDIFHSNIGGPYDLIVASHFYHHFNVDKNIELSKLFMKALRPGGMLAINDFVREEEPKPFGFAQLFSVVMLQWTAEGEAYRESSYRQILEAAGFQEVEKRDNFLLPNAFIFATKPM